MGKKRQNRKSTHYTMARFCSLVSFNLMPMRGFKKHMGDANFSPPQGRSILVSPFAKQPVLSYTANTANRAYFKLRSSLIESKVRETVKLQSRFESNPRRRRRKENEAQWRIYFEEIQKKVRAGLNLKHRMESEQRILRAQIKNEFRDKRNKRR
jgi:hypothetical protein